VKSNFDCIFRYGRRSKYVILYENMKPMATDTYNFEGLITRRYTYVDKTEVLYPHVNDSIGSQFFLSRPRMC
jgi:hypothetical protein